MSLTKIDAESWIRVSHTREDEAEKKGIDHENGYVKWKRDNPPIDCEYSVDKQGNVFCLWTLIVCLSVTYNLLAIPGHVYIQDEEIRSYWLMCNLAADVVYLLDILVQSRLRFFDDGCEQYEPAATRINYCRNHLLLDVLSVCPLEVLGGALPQMAVLRLNRLVKVNRLLELFSLAEGRLKGVVVSALRMGYFITVIFHWNACAYFFLGTHQNRFLTAGVNATFDDDTEWGWPYMPEKVTDLWVADCQMQCEEEGLLFDEEREQALMTLYDKWDNKTIRYEFGAAVKEYVQTFYWSCMTITTLGEQPSPDDTVQTVFETFDTLLGMVVFAGIMGSVGALVGNANRVEGERKQFMDGLKQFMGFRGVGDEMRQRVLHHCAYELGSGQLLHESEVKEEVPDLVYLAVNRFTALVPLARSPLFKGTGYAFLTDLGRQLVSSRLGPGDVLARSGEEQREMYIVARGQLVSEKVDGSHLQIGEGGTVGEEGLICLGEEHNLWKSTVYSREHSQVFVLTRERLLTVLEDYPSLEDDLKRRAAQQVGLQVDTHVPSMAEKLQGVSEVVEELEKQLEKQYAHFINYSTKFKRRLFKMERHVCKMGRK